MPSTQVIDYKGVKIVYTDISGTKSDEAIPTFEKVKEIVKTFPDKSVLSLVNAKDARFNKDLLGKIKEVVKANNPKSKATAVSGLSQLTKLMVNSIIAATGRKMKLFDDEERAKEWLYSLENEAVKA